MQYIKDNLEIVKENIERACNRVGRDTDSVSTVIVTKTASAEQIKEVIKLGYTELGENRQPHLKEVAIAIEAFLAENRNNPDLPKKVNWHMIGHMQRNKVKQIIPIVKIVHSLDTLRLAEEISENCRKMEIKTRALLQINCSEEPQKYGIPVGAAMHLAEQIYSMGNIELLGIMTMAPFTDDEIVIRNTFTRAKEVFDDIKRQRFIGAEFQHLSMGMSNDYQIAVEEGATILRIGSAIFQPQDK